MALLHSAFGPDTDIDPRIYSCKPHFQGQKSDLSSFLVKEVKFRQIEIS